MRRRLAIACACVFAALALRAQSPAPAASPAGGGVQRYDQPVEGALSPRNANYDIEARLDHERRLLSGRQTIRWRNISAATATELQFHLYWNAWRNLDSTWLRERRLAAPLPRRREESWGSIDISAMRVRAPDGSATEVTSRLRFIAPDDGNTEDRTVAAVPLPFAVEPNGTLRIEIEWEARIPRPFARTGYIGDYYFIAHWFPKIGVLEDGGWTTHQFHAPTEFYADYGVYDVSLTVPRAFVVGASGREAGATDNDDGTRTHRYLGEDIHDFAWTASPSFVEHRRTFAHPALPRVEMRLLLQPEHGGQEARHFAAAEAALRYHGEWFGPYPYATLTIVDPAYQSASGGMEYPTLITAGTRWIAPAEVPSPEAVTIHEAGHQFWHGIVGTNEVEHAWMDEGLTTFSTARVLEEIGQPNHPEPRYFGGFVPWVIHDIELSREVDGNRLPGYRLDPEADRPSDPTFRHWPATAGIISYNKTALWLHTLERYLGWPVLRRVLSTYFERWKFRHPEPEDFFAVASEAAGQDLTWFFDQVYRSSDTFDYGVQDLVSERQQGAGGYRTVVVARRFGEATFPVDVVTTFENGEQVRERWDGVDRRAVYVYEREARARQVQVDPQRVLLLDVNTTNNSRTLQPRGREASLTWSLRWMVWLQDLMLTYGFFL